MELELSDMSSNNPVPTGSIEHRQYPIGALPANEVAGILVNPLCKEQIALDPLMQEWKQKASLYNSIPPANLNTVDTDILPLNVSAGVKVKIDAVVSSCRSMLPPSFDLAFVPIEKLVTPQKSVIVERARVSFGKATGVLSQDAIAQFCLGTPVSVPQIDAALLGVGANPQAPNQVVFVYQFSSLDMDVRPIFPSGLQPFQTVNWSAPGSTHPLELKSIPVTVGPGAASVIVRKVPIGVTGTGSVIYRLIIQNGVHRIFRLAEMGNSHVAAVVHTVTPNELEAVMVDTPREILIGQRPLTIGDLVNSKITKAFQWRRAQNVFKLQVTVQHDRTFV